MKIEKISENQIRCTLSKDDLLDRQLKLSELAYGTEKAKLLFRDMMQQASYEFGFEADDIPLMIEAIPVSSECLVLVVTKVEDPDELDTRFSKFSPHDTSDNDFGEDDDDNSYSDELMNCFAQLDDLLEVDPVEITDSSNSIPKNESDSKETPTEEANGQTSTSIKTPQNAEKKELAKVFSFGSLQDVIQLSEEILPLYHASNTLYKDALNSIYYLVLSKDDHTPQEFNKVCNIISEYGKSERCMYATSAYFEEHFDVIVRNKAVQVLNAL